MVISKSVEATMGRSDLLKSATLLCLKSEKRTGNREKNT